MTLSFELTNRTFENLGAIRKSFGKAGITDKYFIAGQLKLKSDSNIEQYNIYCGELETTTSSVRIALSEIGTDEYVMIMLVKENIFGLYIDHEEKTSSSFIRIEENWVSTSILQQLNILVLFETCTQYGLLWNKLQGDSEAAINILNSFVELIA